MRAEDLAHALGARRSGAGWIARCPAHEDRTPSLSIGVSSSGKLLLHCFAGCAFEDVLAAAGGAPPAPATGAPAVLPVDLPRRQRIARRIWRASHPIAGTLVERYLASRCVAAFSTSELRFAPALAHPSGGAPPAMVAAIRDASGQMIGVHRTWLSANGAGKTGLSPAKAMLGKAKGGFVRLRAGRGPTLIAEGIETALSVATELHEHRVIAALSATGLAHAPLSALSVETAVAADGDAAGLKAARALADRAIGVGKRVRILQPPDGQDWNDVLCALTKGAHHDAE